MTTISVPVVPVGAALVVLVIGLSIPFFVYDKPMWVSGCCLASVLTFFFVYGILSFFS